MKYKEAIAYLNSLVNFERLPETRHKTDTDDLIRFRKMLSNLGNPQNDFLIIHIAGTKGKGSTAAILSSILQKSGYKVGLYTSPHLITVRERIRTNDDDISMAVFAEHMSSILSIPDSLRVGEQAAFRTVFEHLTAIALLNFSESNVDIAIIETGLGGRLDSTVVFEPILSVLTSIGLDHTALLGDTKEEIAYEKSFIIKEGVTAISAPQIPSVLKVFSQRAIQVDSELIIAPGLDEYSKIEVSSIRTKFRSERKWLNGRELEFNLHGEFQLTNLSTALEALEYLKKSGYKISQTSIERGLKNIRWDGRMDIRLNRCNVILDGAHNTLGMEMLSESVEKLFPARKWRVIFASQKNKASIEMLRILQPYAEKLYLTPLQFPKSLTPQMLSEMSKSLGNSTRVFNNASEAYKTALSESDDGEVVLVTGSLYLVGEIYRHLKNIAPPVPDGSIDDRI